MSSMDSRWPVQRQFLSSKYGSVSPEDDYYTRISIQTLTPSSKEVCVTAIRLVVNQNSALYQILSTRTDIGKLIIVADEVIIEADLKVPAAIVEIYARLMRVAGNGSLSTKPAAHKKLPDNGYVDVTRSPPVKNGADGLDGLPGGDINLYLGGFRNEAPGAAFDVSGGVGQAPGAGVKGATGTIAAAWSSTEQLDYRYYTPPGWPGGGSVGSFGSWLTSNRSLDKIDEVDTKIYPDVTTYPGIAAIELYLDTHPIGAAILGMYAKWTPAHPPTDGAPPTSVAGRPGAGGNGGILSSTVTIDKNSVNLKGGSHAPRVSTEGGAAGYIKGTNGAQLRAGTKFIHNSVAGWATFIPATVTVDYPTLPGLATKDGPADPGSDAIVKPSYKDGTIVDIVDHPRQWLHPLHISTLLAYLKDAFISGDLDTVQNFAAAYVAALDQWQAALDKAAKKYDPDDIILSGGLNSLKDLQVRLARGLDYFGNPAGWTPTLSLAAQFSVYQNTVDSALPILFLCNWMEKFAQDATAKASAAKAAINAVEDQRERDIDAFNAIDQTLGDLSGKFLALQSQMTDITTDLQARDKYLNQQAVFDVWANHLLKMASALCSVIPVGQPEFSVAGKALNSLSYYCANHDTTVANAGTDVLSLLGAIGTEAMSKKSQDIKKELQKKPVNNNSDREKAAEELATKSKLLAPATADFAKHFATLCAPDGEIAEQLKVLENEDTYYQQLAEKLKILNKNKEDIFQKLTLAIANMNKLSASIQSSYVHQNTLSDDLAKANTEISHTSLRIVRALADEAMRRLQLYSYYLIKAYEYQFLAPFGAIDLRLDQLVDQIEALLTPTSVQAPAIGPILTTAMQTVLSTAQNAVIAKITDQFQSPPPGAVGGLSAGTASATYTLNADELLALNTVGEIEIDLLASNVIHPEWENVKIESMQISSLTAATGTRAPSNQTCQIAIEGWGDGILRNGKTLYAIRSGDVGAAGSVVRSWSGIYDPHNSTFKADTPAASTIDLLKQLMGTAVGYAPGVLYAPPAWMRLTVSKDEKWLEVASLTFDYSLSYQKANGAQAALIVTEESGAAVPLRVTCNGVTQRLSTGVYQVVDAGQTVTITAEYAGDQMVVGLSDLDDPGAKDVAGTGPWTVQMSSASRPLGDRRLQVKLGAPYYSAPLTAPDAIGCARNRDWLKTNPPLAAGNWALGSRVRYALTFVDKNGTETAPGPWSDAFDPGAYIFTILTDIAFDPSGAATERRLYRQFIDQAGKVDPQELVKLASLANNMPGVVVVDDQL